MKPFVAWLGLTLVFGTVFMLIYSCIHVVRPAEIMLVQHSNGEIDVEDRPGYHFTTGTTAIFQKNLLLSTEAPASVGGGTLYTIPAEYESPNKNLVRIVK